MRIEMFSETISIRSVIDAAPPCRPPIPYLSVMRIPAVAASWSHDNSSSTPCPRVNGQPAFDAEGSQQTGSNEQEE
jgi:hypothetical protein